MERSPEMIEGLNAMRQALADYDYIQNKPATSSQTVGPVTLTVISRPASPAQPHDTPRPYTKSITFLPRMSKFLLHPFQLSNLPPSIPANHRLVFLKFPNSLSRVLFPKIHLRYPSRISRSRKPSRLKLKLSLKNSRSNPLRKSIASVMI